MATFLIVGIYFLFRGYKVKMPNLYYAGLSFLLMAISQLISRMIRSLKIIEVSLIAISLIFVILFINQTFYKERKSMILKKNRRTYLPTILIALTILASIVTCCCSILIDTPLNTPENNLIYLLATVIQRFLVFHWAALSSYLAYKKLRDKNIRPWIKFRYKIFAFTSFLLGFQPIVLFFQPYGIPFGSPHPTQSAVIFGITALIAMMYSIGSLLIWIMPKWLKTFLDRNYRSLDENIDYSEAELLTLIKNQLPSRGEDW
ncbi:MAG: hypothetical protein JW891_01980 [Candidatus Lokiarchaeota archaeon]|nr:hypothetical protein [Candidatus Lokiarchaeota archaeon]